MDDHSPIRLTQFSHGGGCGCKIAPAVLSEILAASPLRAYPPELLVGTRSSDDAAVYLLNEHQVLVATTDFFTPIVDDPHTFGRIAATNALSDIYAMGATPIFALAIVGMPVDKLPMPAIQAILAGGDAVCTDAGIPIAGGHSINALEPIYGLVALGLAQPAHIKRNDTARAGDVLILGKPLGVGILSAALKKGRLSEAGYAQMIAHTTQLNRVGTALGRLPKVHAMTDVTGFGLAGHLLEICRGSKLAAQIEFAALPRIAEAEQLAREGIATGATKRNLDSYASSLRMQDGFEPWQAALISDPQTSGGLLVCCAADSAEVVMQAFRGAGFEQAAIIGRMTDGEPMLRID